MNMPIERVVISELKKGDHFQLKKNGRYFTIHDFVKSNPAFLPPGEFHNVHYVIATCGGKLHLFDFEQKVIVDN